MLRGVRKDIARAQTILREREKSPETAPEAAGGGETAGAGE